MWKSARERIDRPGLWAHTNNHSAWPFTYSWLQAKSEQGGQDLVKQDR